MTSPQRVRSAAMNAAKASARMPDAVAQNIKGGGSAVNVKAMDLDFYVSGTLKYLLGPPGLAFMYVRMSLASSLVPSVTGWFGQADPFAFNVRLFDPAPGARR